MQFVIYLETILQTFANILPRKYLHLDKVLLNTLIKIVRNPNTLYLVPTNSTEILWLINHLPNKTSSGHDEINNLLLKKMQQLF